MSEKSLVEKLQIKPNTRLLFVNPPEGYVERIGALPAGVLILPADPIGVLADPIGVLADPIGVLADPIGVLADFIQVFVKNRSELVEALTVLPRRLARNGALWISYYKGTSKFKTDINRDSIWPIATSFGLQPVRQIAIDEDWSALRFKLIESS
jgi:hypothetical protein